MIAVSRAIYFALAGALLLGGQKPPALDFSSHRTFLVEGGSLTVNYRLSGTTCQSLSFEVTLKNGDQALYRFAAAAKTMWPEFGSEGQDCRREAGNLLKNETRESFKRACEFPKWQPAAILFESHNLVPLVGRARYESVRRGCSPVFSHTNGYESGAYVAVDPETGRWVAFVSSVS